MKLVILDRDGTINVQRDDFIKAPEEWEALPGALEAIARLNHAGWRVVVASNQSGLGRGLFDVVALNAMHAKMHKQLGAVGGRIDAVFFCPHSDSEMCSCRKPAPGLMEQIRDRFGEERGEMVAIGSCLSHLQAAAAIGMKQLHVVCTGASSHLDAAQELTLPWPPGTRAHADLAAFADFIAAEQLAKAATH